MPEFKDLAALPTSWALTLWDALPILLAVEAALAIVLLVAVTGRPRSLTWRITRPGIAGGLVYLLLFDSNLALPYLLLAAVVLALAYRKPTGPHDSEPARSVFEGARERAWDLVGSVAASGALAAILKVLLGPYLASDNPLWPLIAIAGGLLPLGVFGTAALPALAITTATDSLIIGSLWLAAAALRPLVADSIRGLGRAEQTASAPYD